MMTGEAIANFTEGLPKPPLKWAGGKGQLLSELFRLLPPHFRDYIEPFVGGGALFFALARAHYLNGNVVLNDSNAELVHFYTTLRDHPFSLMRRMKEYAHDEETYYAVRAYNPFDLTSVERASRFLFLNRTCFNGLYRENKKGQFNVPFGKYEKPLLCDEPNLLACAKTLTKDRVTIEHMDFEGVLRSRPIRSDTFVYFDPPYLPISKTSDFTSYTKDGFSFKDQERLASLFRELSARGVHCMLSNSGTPAMRELYAGFDITSVNAKRNINSKGDKRGAVSEIIVRSWIKS